MKKLIAGLLLATAFVSGEEPAITRDEVASAIRNLGIEKYDERTAAFEKLASAGEIAYEPLKKVLQSSDDREVKARIERLLPLCAPGGPVRDGVSIRLEVDKPDAKFGETVVLTTIIRNHTNAPRSIFVGINRQNFFSDGGALQYSTTENGVAGPFVPLYQVANSGRFGSAAGPRPNGKRLEPFETWTIKTEVPLFEASQPRKLPDENELLNVHEGFANNVGIGNSRVIKLTMSGTFKLRVFGVGCNERWKNRIRASAEERVVAGDLESNAVEFHLSKP